MCFSFKVDFFYIIRFFYANCKQLFKLPLPKLLRCGRMVLSHRREEWEMELLQLRYFYESAKSGSFAKTAEKYMVPATSVSASVKRLERALGCTLFDRTSNRICLNESGEKLKTSLDMVFSELDRTVGELTSSERDTRKIKLLVRAMRGKITDRIIEYNANHPHIAFKTSFDFGDIDIENFDIIIDGETDTYRGYECLQLYTSEIGLRASVKSPLCGKKLTLRDLRNENFISIGEDNGLHRRLMDACRKAGFVPNIVVQSNDLTCNRKFVESGVGIGISRIEEAERVLNSKACILNVTDFRETQIICAYFKKASAYGNIAHFLEYLKKE